jgi:sulfur carrier protein
MTLRINGQPRDIPPLETVAALVEHLRVPAATLLIEHNGVALRRDEWPATRVGEGDTIEFLQIAAGG